MYQIIDLK